MALIDDGESLAIQIKRSTHFDKLQRCRFGVFYIPFSEIQMGTNQRIHLHTYPHTPGAALEKLGRDPYRIRLQPIFDETVTQYDRGPRGNGLRLYPDVLDRIQQMFEREITAPLIIPTVGTMECMITHFSRRQVWSVRSGEHVELEFIEDMTEAFKTATLFRDADVLLPEKAQLMLDLADDAGMEGEDRDLLQKINDLIDGIFDVANDVLGVVDQAELLANNVAGAIQEVNQLLQRADSKIQMLQNPEHWQVVEAVKDTWSTCDSLLSTITKRKTSAIYVVPRQMTVHDVSQAIYGTTDRVMDILQGNELPDAFAIRAGTEIQYELEAA